MSTQCLRPRILGQFYFSHSTIHGFVLEALHRALHPRRGPRLSEDSDTSDDEFAAPPQRGAGRGHGNQAAAIRRPRADRRVAGNNRLEGVLGGGSSGGVSSSVGVYGGGGGGGGSSLVPTSVTSSSPARVVSGGLGIGGVGYGGGEEGGGGGGTLGRRNAGERELPLSGVLPGQHGSRQSSAAASTKQDDGASGGEGYSSDEFEEEDLPLP